MIVDKLSVTEMKLSKIDEEHSLTYPKESVKDCKTFLNSDVYGFK